LAASHGLPERTCSTRAARVDQIVGVKVLDKIAGRLGTANIQSGSLTAVRLLDRAAQIGFGYRF
jgi:hypothetical protein